MVSTRSELGEIHLEVVWRADWWALVSPQEGEILGRRRWGRGISELDRLVLGQLWE